MCLWACSWPEWWFRACCGCLIIRLWCAGCGRGFCCPVSCSHTLPCAGSAHAHSVPSLYVPHLSYPTYPTSNSTSCPTCCWPHQVEVLKGGSAAMEALRLQQQLLELQQRERGRGWGAGPGVEAAAALTPPQGLTPHIAMPHTSTSASHRHRIGIASAVPNQQQPISSSSSAAGAGGGAPSLLLPMAHSTPHACYSVTWP